MNKTFCILPWIHIYVNPDGSVLPCCVGDHRNPMGNVQDNKIDDIFNNDRFKSMRKKMLSGEKCEECIACYRDEQDGNSSFRKHVNEQFKNYIEDTKNTNIDGSINDYKLRYLDVRWSNICNFKCRSCSATYSSSWAKEDGKENIYIFAGGESNDNLYQQFKPHFDTIEEFYFAGGEPLLMDKHYDILEYLVDQNRTDVRLRYNTNLSSLRYKNKDVLEYWKKFKNVYVGASLDSWSTRAEYIRGGTDWNVIEKNLRLMAKEVPHVNLQTNTVVSLFNVLTIPEFLDYLIENNLVNEKKFKPHFYNIMNPDFYSFKVLPNEFKSLAIEKLQQYITDKNGDIQYGIQGIINGLQSSNYDPLLKEQLQLRTNYYDSLRNQNFLETFPELNKVWF